MTLLNVLAALRLIATIIAPFLPAMLARLVALLHRARHWQYVGPIVRWFAPADDNMHPGQQDVELEGSINAGVQIQQPGALPSVQEGPRAADISSAELLEELRKINGLLEQLVELTDEIQRR